MNGVNRRDFVRGMTMGGAALMVESATWATARATETAPQEKMRGVNLGGWLVLEKWITPTLFAGLAAEDEYTFGQQLGRAKAREKLKRHRDTWITAEDFRWLAARG